MMKQVLLGTTALLAAGLLSGQAMAQASKADPIKLQLGGYLAFAGGDIVRQNDGPNASGVNHTNFQFKENIVLGGLGETKLDNGLIVGANIQLRGQDTGRNVVNNVDGQTGALRSGAFGFAQNDQAAQAYGYFKGEFGQLVFGDVRDATSQKSYQAPIAGQLFGANSPLFTFTNNPIGTNSTIADLGGIRATNLSYFSPTYAGFSFGASFKPVASKGVYSGTNCGGAANPGGATQAYAGSVVGCTAFNNTLNSIDNIGAIHVNYDAKFGDFTVGVGGGAAHATKEKGLRAGQLVTNNGVQTRALLNTDGDKNNYYASFNVIYGPYAIGGAWERQQNQFFNGGNSDTIDVGGRYTIGPAAFSLSATRGYYKGFLATGTGAVGSVNSDNLGTNQSSATGIAPVNFNPTATPTLSVIDAVVNYQLGPGIAISGQFDWEIYHSHAPSSTANIALSSTKNYESIGLMAGTRFNF